jgi:hypothetical protein
MPPPIKDLTGMPNAITTFVRQDPVFNEEGEQTGTVDTEVTCQYCHLVERTTTPMTKYYISQKDTNLFDYEAKTEEEREGLDLTPIAHLMKVGLSGHGFQRGELRYAGEMPDSVRGVEQYLFDRWEAAGILIGPGQ